MLSPISTVMAHALALALFSAALLVAVPRLLFKLEPHVSTWLLRLERWLEEDGPSDPPDGPRPGSTLWPRISGPA